MQDTKKWYQSKGVWGGIIAGIAGLLALFGKTILPEQQSALADAMVQIATGVAAVAGGALAIYGRLKAKKEIK